VPAPLRASLRLRAIGRLPPRRMGHGLRQERVRTLRA